MTYWLFRVGAFHIDKQDPDFEYFYKAGAWLGQQGAFDPGYDPGVGTYRGTLDWYWPSVPRLMTLFAVLPFYPAGMVWLTLNLVAWLALVRLAGQLIETYGYRSSGRTYSIADKNEAWMLAVLRGRHWYAQRVPDDEVAVIPNHYTIHAIHPDDPDHFLGSPDIVEYAAKNGWYDAAKDGAFDFKKAFERPSTREPAADGNALRHWRGLSLLTGRTWELGRDYPFSVKLGKKVAADALMAILRDHYEGTEYDATDGYKTGTPNRTKFRTICTASA